METKATLRSARLSAQKGRLVADLIRGKKIDQAMNILTFSPKKGAVLKRFTARAKGRGDRISKQTCHIYVTVGN